LQCSTQKPRSEAKALNPKALWPISENAGAAEFAPEFYEQANASFIKAEAALKQRRSERAQKLLELSTAQASLAKAISEATLAEQSLGYARSTRY